MFRLPCGAQTANPRRARRGRGSFSLAVLSIGGGGDATSSASRSHVPGTPSIEFVSPRNGAVSAARAVVVKVEIENFRLAPRHFGGEPLTRRGLASASASTASPTASTR